MSCDFVRRFMEAYTDGELDPPTELVFEQHLAGCAGCREQVVFAQAVKAQVAAVVRKTRAPDALRARITTAVRREQRGRYGVGAVPVGVRVAVPLGLAASALLAVAYVSGPSTAPAVGVGPALGTAQVLPLEDIVRVHALPADVAGNEAVQFLRPRVRFPVRPVNFDRRDARFVGARLSNVRDRSAAAYYYEVGGRRVTVVSFPGEDSVEAGFERTRVNGRVVSFVQADGHAIPVRNQDGLNYAFTGDLDRESLFELAATARVQY